MSDYYVIVPGNASLQLKRMLEAVLAGKNASYITDKNSLPDLRGVKIIVCAEISPAGLCIPLYEILEELQSRGCDSLKDSSAILLLHSSNELYTKSTASFIVFLMNQLGCRFPGHPAIEATGSLSNFSTWRKVKEASLEDICLELCISLGERFAAYNPSVVKKPKILALHSSRKETSNTLALWNMVKSGLAGCRISELHVENGSVVDCKGCSYKTCKHFSMNNSCFYGGIMVKEILPAIEKSDAVIWLCPNYNDAVSANLSAVINRMSALYVKTPFYKKSLFSIIVSGNSGSDSVARQLLGALCINKGFNLPPYHSFMATANDPGTVCKIPGIEASARTYAENILKEIKRP
ncbi:MAG TPA: NAD(P)H-dependent oxidoreductase [Clostridia bacterium]|nr:NAD(P)H-dependent oxidoreductase [Clostridia bacterium]